MVRKKTWAPVRPVVVDYLRKHPNEIVMVDDMVSALGLRREQIQSQMRLLIKDGLSVKVISQAAAWQFTPVGMNGAVPGPEIVPEPEPEPIKETPEESRKIFMQIGTTRAGSPLVQDADGVIYVARELE